MKWGMYEKVRTEYILVNKKCGGEKWELFVNKKKREIKCGERDRRVFVV